MYQILIINGSASGGSSNQKLIDNLVLMMEDYFSLTVFNGLKTLPHFDPELSVTGTPKEIMDFRQMIEASDGVVICTPEYVFSIPSGLKNAIEWCVSTTVFSGKPTGLITASANGLKGHEELQLIMRTVMARCIPDTSLLIQGIKGKFDENGEITDRKTRDDLAHFIDAFKKLVNLPA